MKGLVWVRVFDVMDCLSPRTRGQVNYSSGTVGQEVNRTRVCVRIRFNNPHLVPNIEHGDEQ